MKHQIPLCKHRCCICFCLLFCFCCILRLALLLHEGLTRDLPVTLMRMPWRGNARNSIGSCSVCPKKDPRCACKDSPQHRRLVPYYCTERTLRMMVTARMAVRCKHQQRQSNWGAAEHQRLAQVPGPIQGVQEMWVMSHFLLRMLCRGGIRMVYVWYLGLKCGSKQPKLCCQP